MDSAGINVSPIRYSPIAQMPADHTNKRDVMQKKLIDCPISNQDPTARISKRMAVDLALLTGIGHVQKERHRHSYWNNQKWIVLANGKSCPPSVMVNATRKREKEGRRKRALRVAKAADRITYGTTILKIYMGRLGGVYDQIGKRTSKAAIKKGLNTGTRRYTGSR